MKIFTPAVMPDVIAMVKANICRALPPQPDDCDPDKDEPLLEEAWPHLQVTGGQGKGGFACLKVAVSCVCNVVFARGVLAALANDRGGGKGEGFYMS